MKTELIFSDLFGFSSPELGGVNGKTETRVFDYEFGSGKPKHKLWRYVF